MSGLTTTSNQPDYHPGLYPHQAVDDLAYHLGILRALTYSTCADCDTRAQWRRFLQSAANNNNNAQEIERWLSPAYAQRRQDLASFYSLGEKPQGMNSNDAAWFVDMYERGLFFNALASLPTLRATIWKYHPANAGLPLRLSAPQGMGEFDEVVFASEGGDDFATFAPIEFPDDSQPVVLTSGASSPDLLDRTPVDDGASVYDKHPDTYLDSWNQGAVPDWQPNTNFLPRDRSGDFSDDDSGDFSGDPDTGEPDTGGNGNGGSNNAGVPPVKPPPAGKPDASAPAKPASSGFTLMDALKVAGVIAGLGVSLKVLFGGTSRK